MHPVHDLDALLLLAMMICSKRRPPELVEIIAAIELSQESIPSDAKLVQAFARLGSHGLLSESAGRPVLTPTALSVVAGLPKKADTAERLFLIRERLGAYSPAGEHPPVAITPAQVNEAVVAYRNAAQTAGSNQFMPKPGTAVRDDRRPGAWHGKPGAARRRG